MQTWLYLHGFNSSSKSKKAQQLLAWAENQPSINVLAPDLPDEPEQVDNMLENLVHQVDGVIGSSLGGFYALLCHARFNIPAVLINPAINPHQLLADRLGPQQHYYSDHQWQLSQHHIDHWHKLAEELTPDQRCLLLMQTKDEIINAAFTVERLAGIRQIVEAGGNHSFVGFERYFSIIEQHFHQ